MLGLILIYFQGYNQIQEKCDLRPTLLRSLDGILGEGRLNSSKERKESLRTYILHGEYCRTYAAYYVYSEIYFLT